ncbi:MAG: SRPBCC family protein [Gammaproteobacteria bacterium]|nr:SRPBCC family protein [Gammaproteobacteria bacterium]
MGIILIDAPIDQVWEVINDRSVMGEYVPDLKHYKVLAEEKKENNIADRLIV